GRSWHLPQGRYCGGAGRERRSGGLPRRHAASRCRLDQPADRRLLYGAPRTCGRAEHRWQARQSGGLVAPLLPRPDGDPGRRRGAPSDRQLYRSGRRSAGGQRGGVDRRGHSRVASGGQGRNRAGLRFESLIARADSLLAEERRRESAFFHLYARVRRALVVIALVLARATLMLVAVNPARAAIAAI